GDCCLKRKPNQCMHDVAKPFGQKRTMKSKIGAFVTAIVGFVVLVILLVGMKALQIHKMVAAGEGGMPPTTVTSAEVKQENWPGLLSSVGSVSAVQGAVISTELGGVVAE